MPRACALPTHHLILCAACRFLAASAAWRRSPLYAPACWRSTWVFCATSSGSRSSASAPRPSPPQGLMARRTDRTGPSTLPRSCVGRRSRSRSRWSRGRQEVTRRRKRLSRRTRRRASVEARQTLTRCARLARRRRSMCRCKWRHRPTQWTEAARPRRRARAPASRSTAEGEEVQSGGSATRS
eukprot:6205828-Pleurochrysis_carterae.AAC.3